MANYKKLYFVFKSLYSLTIYSCANKQSQAEFMILALDETKYEARMEFSASFGLGQLDMNNRILQEC